MTTNYFARYIGLSRGENLYQIKRGHNGISRKLGERIVQHFPQIDLLWLLTGRGQMFVSGSEDRGAQIPFFNADVEKSIRGVELLSPDGYVVLPMGATMPTARSTITVVRWAIRCLPERWFF
ncbi:hypothetical protein [Alistipes communis]|uniref:hypothetical protein n=1 Tax=Alistipes communis TaxID=2585118 RepID=UPI00242B28F4|nr:hypothetical protein [Alistipes communis]